MMNGFQQISVTTYIETETILEVPKLVSEDDSLVSPK
jgi:hypothetical protein